MNKIYIEEIGNYNLSIIINYIYNHTKDNINIYKSSFIYRCINKRINSTCAEDINHYIKILRSDPNEVFTLQQLFWIQVTRFFRDEQVFDLARDNIIPQLIEKKFHEKKLRIWIPACCTGEEAYSFAIIINEYLEKTGEFFDVKIFATDIDSQALKKASAGIYDTKIASSISSNLLNKYFNKVEERYQIRHKIRNMVVFGYHNIICNPPFTKMDLISCRNVLIYIDEKLQKNLPSIFHYSLNENGILILGTSEYIHCLEKYFSSISPKWKIFCKKNECSKVEALLNFPTKDIGRLESKVSG